jgi:hypothetical protein
VFFFLAVARFRGATLVFLLLVFVTVFGVFFVAAFFLVEVFFFAGMIWIRRCNYFNNNTLF